VVDKRRAGLAGKRGARPDTSLAVCKLSTMCEDCRTTYGLKTTFSTKSAPTRRQLLPILGPETYLVQNIKACRTVGLVESNLMRGEMQPCVRFSAKQPNTQRL
jgi:hypothetical protein